MTDYLPIELNHKTVYLLAEKGVFFPHNRTLVIADVHLGKAVHFRKEGIMIPSLAGTLKDYQALHLLIHKYQPLRIIFLGDLFHSAANASWNHFILFTKAYPHLKFILIRGNHDLLTASHYNAAGLEIYPDLHEDNFLLSHAPLASIPEQYINIAGHIHPATRLRGRGRQRLTLPCFHFADPYLLLPAFGSLTGTFVVRKGLAKQYVVAGKKVMAI